MVYRLHISPHTVNWERLFNAPVLAVDTETSGLDPLLNQLRCVQICCDGEVDVFDLRRDKFEQLTRLVRSWGDKLVYFHNAKFDLKFLMHHLGAVAPRVYDTKLTEQLLTTNHQVSTSLATLAKKYLGLEMDKSIRETFTLPLFDTLDLTEDQIAYSAKDAWVLPLIAEAQAKHTSGLQTVMDLEFKLAPVVAQLELKGIGFDKARWLELARQAEEKSKTLAKELAEISGVGFANFNSEEAVMAVFAKLGLKVPEVKGKRTTMAEHIERINHPFVTKLLEYRDATKLATTYGREFVEFVHPLDGRIHAEFEQLGTETGRFTSKSPNMQQIPSKPEYRSCFVASPGHKMISADFVQQELVLMAELSQDPNLIKAFSEDLDIHRLAAAQIFGVAYDEVTKEQRSMAKVLNFGLAYGSGPQNLANKLNVSLSKAESLVNDYWQRFAVLKQWHRRSGLIAWRLGYSKTILGRHRFYPRNAEQHVVMRLGPNHQIQGSGGDMVKLAMIKIYEKLGPVLVNQVHDELEAEVEAGRAEEAACIIKSCMEEAGAELVKTITQKVDVVVGDCWSK